MKHEIQNMKQDKQVETELVSASNTDQISTVDAIAEEHRDLTSNNNEQGTWDGGPLKVMGIHPGCTVLLITVDSMLFGATLATAGLGIIFSIPVGLIVGIIVTIFQKKMYGDDWILSSAKGLVFALLTAIPTPLPSAITMGSGAMGGIQTIKQVNTKTGVINKEKARKTVFIIGGSLAAMAILALSMIIVAIVIIF